MREVFYTVYQTTCLVNGKTYVGCHKTSNPNDSYLGSGVLFSKAVAKYGKENFKKEVLFIFDNPEEMLTKEHELVVVDPETTYNLDRGGRPGWGSRDPEKHRKACRETGRLGALILTERMKDPVFRSLVRDRKQNTLNIHMAADPEWAENFSIQYEKFLEMGRTKALSEESRSKRIEAFQEIDHAKGTQNSQYGTCWVHRNDEPKKIQKSALQEFLSQGYVLGRGSSFKNHMTDVGPRNLERSSSANTKWMVKDGVNHQIPLEAVEEHLSSGYVLGKIQKGWAKKTFPSE